MCIRDRGIVENISGSHLQVRIVQTSACASCSIKGHCSSSDTKEKIIGAKELEPDKAELYDVGINTLCNAECPFCYVSASGNGINYPSYLKGLWRLSLGRPAFLSQFLASRQREKRLRAKKEK